MSIYQPTEWVNDNPPPLNEDNLNHAEQGAEDAHLEIDEIGFGNTTVAHATTCGTATYVAGASETVVGAVRAWVTEDSKTGELIGFMESAGNLESPLPVTTLIASDNLPGMVEILFSTVIDATSYDLLQNDVVVATGISPAYRFETLGGTWDFRIRSNNFSESTVGVADSGTALSYPTAIPVKPAFSASDNLAGSIEFNWDVNGDAFRYAIYRDNALFEPNAKSGEKVITGEGAWSFYVIASNQLGDTHSDNDSGTALQLAPTAIADFSATDTLTASIEIDFTVLAQPATYALYRNAYLLRESILPGVVIPSPAGTWDFKVRAISPLGEEDSNIDSGTSIAAVELPEQVTDFRASDFRRGEVVIEFTAGVDAENYSLYKDDVLVEGEVYSGFKYQTGEAGTWKFYIVGANTVGSTKSNDDSGSSTEDLSGPPTQITNFTASEGLQQLLIVFTEVIDADRFDLYRDGKIIHMDVNSGDYIPSFSGEWQFYILAVNGLGDTPSNEDTGSVIAPSLAPGAILDFDATDDEIEKVTIDFTLAEYASSHDLYRGDDLVASAVLPGHDFITSAGGPWTFKVRAINIIDFTDSNTDEGTSEPADIA